MNPACRLNLESKECQEWMNEVCAHCAHLLPGVEEADLWDKWWSDELPTPFKPRVDLMSAYDCHKLRKEVARQVTARADRECDCHAVCPENALRWNTSLVGQQELRSHKKEESRRETSATASSCRCGDPATPPKGRLQASQAAQGVHLLRPDHRPTHTFRSLQAPEAAPNRHHPGMPAAGVLAESGVRQVAIDIDIAIDITQSDGAARRAAIGEKQIGHKISGEGALAKKSKTNSKAAGAVLNRG
ncbi:uncharacterized protein LOC6536750 isoform X1 [Drosophila yakuba]|uniref:Uncharacterized protein, isoform B n=1 Tax=Drosophila yakuba TaxID=7245 RepID=A0A0R1E2K0_DROYA|nr:uncharacterized protein LOC6536750 isoform X1 [Drosophila yakuba]KRK03504.1 uncharacterized protein Dyak_GE24557, isoform B [Drosophila yakuba]